MTVIVLLGFTVGIILALTGAGGGILAVPLLVFGAGLSMAQAGPIGLLAVGLAAALGAVMGLKSGTVRYKAAMLIAGAGIICSPFGLWLAQRSPNRPLAILFSIVLLYVSLRVYLRASAGPADTADTAGKAQRVPPCQLDARRGKLHWTAPCARALALAGVLAGVLSGLLGVGGGFVMVPALQRYTDLTMQSIVATSLAVIALVSLAGVVASTASGHLQWAIALPFALGSLAGMTGGRLLASRLPAQQLQKTFAIVSTVAALALFIKAI